MRTPSRACFDIIREFEGCKLKAYPDPGTGSSPWTVGWGHTGPDVTRNTVWTLDQAKAALQSDVTKFAACVSRIVGDCTDGQFSALVSFAYNFGLANLKSSTLLRYHLAGQYAAAAKAFFGWTHAAGKELPGLVNRRAAESRLYLS